MKNGSIVIAGVADQPVYKIASLIADRMMAEGETVAVSGSPEARAGKGINAIVRWGGSALSPLVPKGTCRAVIGLEALEGIREAIAQYAPGLTLYLSDRRIPPNSVLHKGKVYPEIAVAAAQLEAAGVKVVLLDAVDKSDDRIAAEVAEMALAQVR